MEVVFTRADVGCFFDSHRGRYIGHEVILLAEEHGHDISELRATYAAVHCVNVGGMDTETATFEEWLVDECEFYHEEWDDAENYLCGLCDNDVYFGSNESGDTGVWLIEDDEDGSFQE